ncbi:hypothetical protein [Aeromonas sp.]|uniref:hypothetical protein n=1 Tax=Aeromonas sp. TaxID=647 RepID=UPI0025848088|nr:hypothetical protein [Aeromonas sp.]MCX7132318.1 hypothetical protein [Aeromonas sp.]
MARRSELQNKPSWKDAPEWATHLAQAGNGCWFFLGGGRILLRTNDMHEQVWSAKQAETREWKGEVLGDWRDTLERRPADLSEPAVTQRLDEATQNVLAAVPALMDEQFKFYPDSPVDMVMSIIGAGSSAIEQKAAEAEDLTGKVTAMLRKDPGLFSANELAELHQLCDAELTKRDATVCGGQKCIDAHWFERGELPPVGTQCEAISEPDMDWLEVEVIAHRDGFAIVWCSDEKCGANCDDPKHFRPIRTEREKAIEEMMGSVLAVMNRGLQRRLCEDLYDAGYRKQEDKA